MPDSPIFFYTVNNDICSEWVFVKMELIDIEILSSSRKTFIRFSGGKRLFAFGQSACSAISAIVS